MTALPRTIRDAAQRAFSRCAPAVSLAALQTSLLQAQPPAPATRDSAGVRIVVHESIRNAPLLNLIRSASSVELGGVRSDPREEFSPDHPFPSAHVLSDGRILAVDKAALKLLDPTGRLLRITGRAGQGPGEFTQIRSACVTLGDSIFTFDYRTRTVSLFNARGDFVRAFTPDGRARDCFSDGTLLITAPPVVNPNTTLPPATASAIDLRMDVTRTRSDGSVAAFYGMFSAEWARVLTPNVVSLTAYGDGFLFGDGNPAEVRRFDRAGQLLQIIRWNDRAVPVSPELLRREAERMGFEPAQMASLLRRPSPDSLPSFMRVLADSAGRIWVEDHYRAQPHGWTVFDAAGRLLGRVEPKRPDKPELPAELLGFSRGMAVLRWRDADEAAHVSLHIVR